MPNPKNSTSSSLTTSFGDSLMRSLDALHEALESDPAPKDEPFIDCQGKTRIFRWVTYGGGISTWLAAVEVIDGEPKGMKIREQFDEDRQEPPYYEVRGRIHARLAQRDIVRNPKEKKSWHVLTNQIRAQITSEPGSAGPILLIDGEEITWKEFGGIVETYEGWGFHVRFTEE